MTNKELVNFANTARAYLALKQNDKLSYAIRKVLKRVDLDLEAYNEAISDARIDFAATDSDGLLVEGKNSSFKYERESLKKLNAKVAEIMKKEVDVSQKAYYATELPKDLDQAYVDAFVGFVIDPALVDEDGILLPIEDEECNGECEGCESKGAEQCKKGKKRK